MIWGMFDFLNEPWLLMPGISSTKAEPMWPVFTTREEMQGHMQWRRATDCWTNRAKSCIGCIGRIPWSTCDPLLLTRIWENIYCTGFITTCYDCLIFFLVLSSRQWLPQLGVFFRSDWGFGTGQLHCKRGQRHLADPIGPYMCRLVVWNIFYFPIYWE